MGELIIKNGFVFDPLQRIKGDRMDIGIKDGKIVETTALANPKTIDAAGMTVMAGGVDIHSHVVGPKVNVGRLFRPEDKLFKSPHKSPTCNRMEMGFSVPSTFKTGYDYARMGYVFVNEAAMPPLHSPHVHEEIRDTPIIDNAAMPVFGNNWFTLDYLKNNEIENNAAYTAWLLRATRGFAIKVVNPGGTEAWGWGLNCDNIHDPVPYFDITPAEIVKGLIETNEFLGLPHSMHLHCNNLGNPGNYTDTLDSFKLAEGYTPKNNFGRDQVMHVTHVQFCSYGGDSWRNVESRADKIMDYVNSHENITIDMGQVTLDETTTMTADGPFEHHLRALNNLKWANTDVELETAAGVVPYIYSPTVKVCTIQWAIGLELALYAKDPMRTFITTDHPNAGPFTRYPRVIKWLMSRAARDETMKTFKWLDRTIESTTIDSIDRELTLYEIAQMTRAGPAKALGISNIYGGLAPGMDADVAIYALNPEDMPSDPEMIENAFSRCAYLIKDGVVTVKGGEVVSEPAKRTVWVDVKVPENAQVQRDIYEHFLRHYSVGVENYKLFEEHLHNPRVIEVDSTQ
ncbi:formylmethanofuran dehydrogenase subunit A [Methanoculleus bourgensis MS2]|uniref:Formylmethanofuran dehydrogenase subunit A n=1 Tax=Methanoculleus bourgensis (strain ATCC 43281 / DSM 3045 / OCM 15 / MS2) TaxID=1201294 RepID=I7KZS9_METBM|nr:formylmethanofuran dehydrogenase subunit A [Methanoculleus bourgensis]CCJ36450.1 formylmethanofuran dehydrogenase subunit A [Methanoculleus bourgensis MS2]